MEHEPSQHVYTKPVGHCARCYFLSVFEIENWKIKTSHKSVRIIRQSKQAVQK